MHIGIVAGELSGDLLGGSLIRTLRECYPNAQIEGVGGQHMLAAGFDTYYPLETLSVMGLVEVIKHFRRIKQCRDQLRDHFLASPPDVFVGIDAPDFNLGLERILKQTGIPTVHYVSPSVWAWRQYRLPKIAQACDLMLTLFPFEAEYYQQHQIPVKFVGHPLADEIPLHIDSQIARQRLNLEDKTWIALLPGSRVQEVEKLGTLFLQTAQWLIDREKNLNFIVPLANSKIKSLFLQQLAEFDLPIKLVDGQSREVMTVADVILMASGTATLEAMLLKKPMVVAYRLAPATYWLAKKLVKVPYFSLPNLLAKRSIVPEFLQHEATAENLGKAILFWLEHPNQADQLTTIFTDLHQSLRQSASHQAAQGILSLTQVVK